MYLDGARILLTGVSGGFGSSMARLLLNKGAVVIGVDCVSPPSDLDVKNFEFVQADLAEKQGLENVEEYVGRMDSIDVLINNAALIHPSTFAHLDEESIVQEFAVNSIAPLLLYKKLMARMNKSEFAPHVFNISSIATTHGAPYCSGYVCSKKALDGLTLAINEENSLFGKILATTVHLGPMQTGIQKHLRGWPGISLKSGVDTLPIDAAAEMLVFLIGSRGKFFTPEVTITHRSLNNERPLVNPKVPQHG